MNPGRHQKNSHAWTKPNSARLTDEGNPILLLKNPVVLPLILGLFISAGVFGCLILQYLWPDVVGEWIELWILAILVLGLLFIPSGIHAGEIIIDDSGIKKRNIFHVICISWPDVKSAEQFYVDSNEWGQQEVIVIAGASCKITISRILCGSAGWWDSLQKLIQSHVL